jgi:hypothetical protein
MSQIHIMGEEHSWASDSTMGGGHELYFGIGPGKTHHHLRKHKLTLLGLPCKWVDLGPNAPNP